MEVSTRVVTLRSQGAWPLAFGVTCGGSLSLRHHGGDDGIREADHIDITNVVMAGVEGAVPLMAGIGAATIVSYEPAMELQLTVPAAYRVTMLRRLTLFLGWSSLVEVAAVAVLAGFWPWTLTRSGLEGYLFTWLAPLLWFGAWGAVLTLLLRSRAASVADSGSGLGSRVALPWSPGSLRLDARALCLCHDVSCRRIVLEPESPGIDSHGAGPVRFGLVLST